MKRLFFLILVLLFASTTIFSQDFSVPRGEKKEQETEQKVEAVEEPEIPSGELIQVKRSAIFKVRPASMLISPVSFNAFRNLNGEVEIGVSQRLSLSLSGNYVYLNNEDFAPDSIAVKARAYSLRFDVKYYFKKKKSKDTYYSMEGWYIGAYYKWVYDIQDFIDPFDPDVRSSSNIVGVLGGYQWIFGKGVSLTPLAGFGIGISTLSTGMLGIRPDIRAGVSIGFTPF